MSYHRELPEEGEPECVPDGQQVAIGGDKTDKISTCESYKTNSYLLLDPLGLTVHDADSKDVAVIITEDTAVKAIG